MSAAGRRGRRARAADQCVHSLVPSCPALTQCFRPEARLPSASFLHEAAVSAPSSVPVCHCPPSPPRPPRSRHSVVTHVVSQHDCPQVVADLAPPGPGSVLSCPRVGDPSPPDEGSVRSWLTCWAVWAHLPSLVQRDLPTFTGRAGLGALRRVQAVTCRLSLSPSPGTLSSASPSSSTP